MKTITVSNFKSELTPDLVKKLPEKLRSAFAATKNAIDFIDLDKEFKEMVENYISQVNKSLNKKIEPINKPKSQKQDSLNIPNGYDFNFKDSKKGDIENTLLSSLKSKGVKIVGNKDWQKNLGVNEIYVAYKGRDFRFFDNGGEFKVDDVTPSGREYLAPLYFSEFNTISKMATVIVEVFENRITELNKAGKRPTPKFKKSTRVSYTNGDKVYYGKIESHTHEIDIKTKKWEIEYKVKKEVGSGDTFVHEARLTKSPLINGSTSKKTANPKPDQVSEVALEVRYIKRYVLMDGKRKTKKQVLTFINTMQRAIEKKQIRKTSKYAKEIMHIQKELIKLYKDCDIPESFSFSLDTTDKKVIGIYTQIAKSQKQRTSVRLITRFIGIHGRLAVKQKAERLLKSIKQAISTGTISKSDPYLDQIKDVQRDLESYIGGKQRKIEIDASELKGLQGIASLMGNNSNTKVGDAVRKVSDNGESLKKLKGCANNIVKAVLKTQPESLKGVHESKGIMSSVEMAKMEHHPIGFKDKWLQLIGDPVLPFSMMFWSKAGMGKSSLAIELSKYFAGQFNKKVLYVAAEEGFSYTIQDKFKRFDAVHPNTSVAPNIPNELAAYDIVFIDSVTRLGMSVEDFIDLKQKYPNKTFVLIFQATVDGNYRGSKEFEHEVDVSVYINENGYANALKSRFGGTGTLKVFKGEPDHIYKFTNLQDAEKFMSNRKNEKLRIVVGDDGKKWVTNPDKAKELAMVGYELY